MRVSLYEGRQTARQAQREVESCTIKKKNVKTKDPTDIQAFVT